MIKVGIIGAESQAAGELLRIIVHHPEVELICAYSPELRGRSITSHHRGLVGDTELRFSDTIDFQQLDVVFITSPVRDLPVRVSLSEGLKVIHIQDNDDFVPLSVFESFEYVPGVSEMYRKPLVRGAVASRILPPPVSVALIALFPLALNLLLNDTLTIKVKMPESMMASLTAEKMGEEILTHLQKVQLSLHSIKSIEIATSETVRALSVETEFDCKVSEEEIDKIFNQTYDDHNFSFIVRNDPSPTEVAGTHKCLIFVKKLSEDRLFIKAVADSVLRGGAGDAVHAMNLLFGLFEKIGLSFPAGLAFTDLTHNS